MGGDPAADHGATVVDEPAAFREFGAKGIVRNLSVRSGRHRDPAADHGAKAIVRNLSARRVSVYTGLCYKEGDRVEAKLTVEGTPDLRRFRRGSIQSVIGNEESENAIILYGSAFLFGHFPTTFEMSHHKTHVPSARARVSKSKSHLIAARSAANHVRNWARCGERYSAANEGGKLYSWHIAQRIPASEDKEVLTTEVLRARHRALGRGRTPSKRFVAVYILQRILGTEDLGRSGLYRRRT